jgi:prevent-host-death family protein
MDINISAARKQLSRLIDQVNAGEGVVITRHGRPVARLVPAEAAKPRKPGLLEGKRYWIADDPFDRLPIAQACHERLTLVTRDPDVRRYPVDPLWTKAFAQSSIHAAIKRVNCFTQPQVSRVV